jgi:murein DD-endopeptidase MepM/ murein hydrolase activator NlpD
MKKRKFMIADFLADRGFYIVLVLCVAAIGISGYVLFFGGEGSVSDTLYSNASVTAVPENVLATESMLQTAIPESALHETEVVMEDDAEALMESSGGDSLQNSSDGADTPDEASAADEEVQEVANLDPASFYVWPVNGKVLNNFCMDMLVFNSTLKDWRVHSGADIEANLGQLVGAIGDGTIKEIRKDEMLGWSVTVDHGGGISSIYCNLMESIPVAVGDTVRAGDTIGGVGQTADSETETSPHLHLEVLRDGKVIDPLEILP